MVPNHGGMATNRTTAPRHSNTCQSPPALVRSVFGEGGGGGAGAEETKEDRYGYSEGGSWKSEGQLILILESDRLFMVY